MKSTVRPRLTARTILKRKCVFPHPGGACSCQTKPVLCARIVFNMRSSSMLLVDKVSSAACRRNDPSAGDELRPLKVTFSKNKKGKRMQRA